ncbi:hypothetical protein ATCC90586_002658 [Pythium insidiosum]|nr:hypothetical protein ATCC90586_002658 [Pythium insidiosum]
MSESWQREHGDKDFGGLQPAAPTTGNALSVTLGLSPLVQLMPTGYRDIQPFQRGQAWHANGSKPASNKARRPREQTSERVVFPVIPSAYEVSPSRGPKASAVVREQGTSLAAAPGRDEDPSESRDPDSHSHFVAPRPPALQSPHASAIPTAPSAPRRPPPSEGRSDNNQRTASGGSFRTRALAASLQSSGSTAASSLSPTTSLPHYQAADDDEDYPAPDAATMEKLWQEYDARTRHPTKTVDRETYHRRMQQRYNETKLLRERIARLEAEVMDARRERDETQELLTRSVQQSVIARWKDRDTDDAPGEAPVDISSAEEAAAAPAPIASPRRSVTSATHRDIALPSPEEESYRARAGKLEKALLTAKERIAELQARLLALHDDDRATVSALQAQCELERATNVALSRQLRETNAALQSTADTLVETQVALEREQTEKAIALQQIQRETRQLISDHKRKELQSRVRNVVRTLGKDALRQKMEAMHNRVLVAEHHMHTAQLEVQRLQTERAVQQQQLDAILSSRALKYHTLAPEDGGVDGILRRATTLFHGTRVLQGQHLLVHLLYEDLREEDVRVPATNQLAEPTEDPPLEDGFSIHVLVYEAFTAQDDYVTFHLRDIQRLVPDSERYLARHDDRRNERYLALAELLLAQSQIGYKNGHLVITERPVELRDDSNVGSARKEITIYRGSHFIRCRSSTGTSCDQLVELVVNEVYAPAMSQLWWIQVHATVVLTGETVSVSIDSQQLKALCPALTGYRPSDSMSIDKQRSELGEEHGEQRQRLEEREAFGVHEELLAPLLAGLELHTDGDAALTLTVVDSSSHVLGITMDPLESMMRVAASAAVDNVETDAAREQDSAPVSTCEDVEAAVPHVLDHRSIVGLDDELFYCLRIQEVWDGELMLLVTMEEPDDSTHRFETLLNESQLEALASYLFRTGQAEADHAGEIKYGLPQVLHAPMCKLIRRHVRPQVPTAATAPLDSLGAVSSPRTRRRRTSAFIGGDRPVAYGSISLATLLNEVARRAPPPSRSSEAILPRDVSLPSSLHVRCLTVGSVTVAGDIDSSESEVRRLIDACDGDHSERFVLRRDTLPPAWTLVTVHRAARRSVLVAVLLPLAGPLEPAAAPRVLLVTQSHLAATLTALGYRLPPQLAAL